jgi:hypothetical protein
MVQFQYFSNNIGSNVPIGYLTLGRFLKAHKSPAPRTLRVFSEIAKAEINNDMKTKAKLKQENLYYFTPCVHLKGGRKYSDILRFTGLLVLDFDHIENAQEFKEYLFNEYPYIIASWLSPSKHGVKALVSIPESSDVKEFKEYFNAVTEVMEVYDGFDSCNKNAVLPLFQSYDDTLLYRVEFETFYKKKAIKEYDYSDHITSIAVRSDDKDKQSVYNIITSSINKIQGEGHPQLRGAAIMLGGYVSSGYLDYYEAESYLHQLIEQNAYLKKGVYGYKKTATWGIKEGLKRQLML